MKKGRFLWSAHRITEKQKAGKARKIKEKRQLKNFNTVLKQLVELRSSPNVNHTFRDVQFQKDFTNLSGNAPWEVYIFEKL